MVAGLCNAMIGNKLITKQTPPEGIPVSKVLGLPLFILLFPLSGSFTFPSPLLLQPPLSALHLPPPAGDGGRGDRHHEGDLLLYRHGQGLQRARHSRQVGPSLAAILAR